MPLAAVVILADLLWMQPGPAEELRFVQPLVNLGELRSHVVRQLRCEFVNQGAVTIEIERVEPSCGCVAATLEQRRFPPGTRGELLLEIRPKTQANGPHAWFARVVYRAGERTGTAHLQLQAVVCADVSVTPTVLMWTGAGQREVTIADQRDPPMTVTQVQFSSPLVRADAAPAGKGQTRIVLQARSPFPVGRFDETLSIYTSDPLYSPLQIPVTLIGQARSPITITPDQVERKVPVGQTVPATLIRLRPSGQHAVHIEKVTTDDPAITCTFAHGPFNEATMRIQIDSAKLGERGLNGNVRVQVRQPVEEELVIPVRISR